MRCNVPQLFGVDGVPHLAYISREHKLLKTLVGNVPEGIVESNIQDLL